MIPFSKTSHSAGIFTSQAPCVQYLSSRGALGTLAWGSLPELRCSQFLLCMTFPRCPATFAVKGTLHPSTMPIVFLL